MVTHRKPTCKTGIMQELRLFYEKLGERATFRSLNIGKIIYKLVSTNIT